MFGFTCPTRDRYTLVFDTQIERVRTTPDGFEVDFSYWCGAKAPC